LIERRKRYAEIKEKIEQGEITEINDFVSYNLNIRQFVQDILENTDDPDLIRHFFKAIAGNIKYKEASLKHLLEMLNTKRKMKKLLGQFQYLTRPAVLAPSFLPQ